MGVWKRTRTRPTRTELCRASLLQLEGIPPEPQRRQREQRDESADPDGGDVRASRRVHVLLCSTRSVPVQARLPAPLHPTTGIMTVTNRQWQLDPKAVGSYCQRR